MEDKTFFICHLRHERDEQISRLRMTSASQYQLPFFFPARIRKGKHWI